LCSRPIMHTLALFNRVESTASLPPWSHVTGYVTIAGSCVGRGRFYDITILIAPTLAL
jgi:hypothetical protein